jgi:two-component system chemotaxis response regulator CheB
MDASSEFDFVVAIGASHGGLSAVRDLLAALPRNLRAPVIVALHGDSNSRLSEVLAFQNAQEVRKLEQGDSLQEGRIHVVPGGRHAYFRHGKLMLSEAVSGKGFRPSIDLLFMTMASEFGRHALGVILSGELKDGMRGAQIIYDLGGRTIVQDPSDAENSSMPNSIIFNDHPETIRSAEDLGTWLGELIGGHMS